MELTIPQRVDKGIGLLETYFPDGQWALKVDPNKLNMASGGYCVLGQLAQHILPPDHWNYDSAGFCSTVMYIEGDQDVACVHDLDWAAEYGFLHSQEYRDYLSDVEFAELFPDMAEVDPHIYTDHEYRLLQAEWTKRINEIREASDG